MCSLNPWLTSQLSIDFYSDQFLKNPVSVNIGQKLKVCFFKNLALLRIMLMYQHTHKPKKTQKAYINFFAVTCTGEKSWEEFNTLVWAPATHKNCSILTFTELFNLSPPIQQQQSHDWRKSVEIMLLMGNFDSELWLYCCLQRVWVYRVWNFILSGNKV